MPLRMERAKPWSSDLGTPLTRGDGRMLAARASTHSQGPSSEIRSRLLWPRGPRAQLQPQIASPRCPPVPRARHRRAVTAAPSSSLNERGRRGETPAKQTDSQSSLTTHGSRTKSRRALCNRPSRALLPLPAWLLCALAQPRTQHSRLDAHGGCCLFGFEQ